ncbi:MAG: hypothetical protein ABJN65_05595 [Parasphingorhabdus sp.]
MESVWIFQGEDAEFCSAVFKQHADAEIWINEDKFSGILTKYPVDTSVYDWAVQERHFQPDIDNLKAGRFIQNFTTAAQEHFHYQNGNRS